jgi:hypothetical protein
MGGVFEALRRHRRIAVTGPQRSGTTIAAKMIAADTGYRCFDELDYGVFDTDRWRGLMSVDGAVVQCPHMLKDIVDDPPPDIFVVLMRRDLPAIHASAVRIGWRDHPWGNVAELWKFGLREGDSASVKYEYWEGSPKSFPYVELPYDLLRRHPLFVSDELRRRFRPKQTAV